MVVVVGSRSPNVVLLLAAALMQLLAFTANAAGSSTICDTAECGKGTCSEVPGIIPVILASYKCTCDPGWSQPTLFNLSLVKDVAPFLPCIIPDYLLHSSCYNITKLDIKGIPTDLCEIFDCGYGDCKPGPAGFFNYSCECKPGYANFLGSTMFPCIDINGCTLGAAAPPESSPSAAPPTGSVSSWRLLQQLLSLAVVLLQVV